jgi:hypothetical protein
MRRASLGIAIVLSFVGGAWASDREKAENQIRIMTAMSQDDTARAIMSRTFADAFKMERPQMIVQRKSLGLNYGGLFLAHELVLSGTGMEQIAEQRHSRRSILDIASASGVDWKRIASDAKKMNNSINDAIYKHFLHSQPDEIRDQVEHYNPAADWIREDADTTPEEIVKAGTEYIFRRNLAVPRGSGQADPGDPVAHTYTADREAIGTTHGKVYPGSPPQ